MKRKYISPEAEIISITEREILTLSSADGSNSPDVDADKSWFSF